MGETNPESTHSESLDTHLNDEDSQDILITPGQHTPSEANREPILYQNSELPPLSQSEISTGPEEITPLNQQLTDRILRSSHDSLLEATSIPMKQTTSKVQNTNKGTRKHKGN